uniref:Poly(A) binding protein interacting protein 2B n=2 Tax=Gallus gallus TaxID=9031 RepID=A0A8V0Y654_CHICK
MCMSLITAFLNCRLQIKDAAMKDPSRSSTSPSIISEDVIINGHSHEDDNPFAEYMWMENEEEFNRQASRFPLSMPHALPCRVVAVGSGAVPPDQGAGLGILLWWHFRWVC